MTRPVPASSEELRKVEEGAKKPVYIRRGAARAESGAAPETRMPIRRR